MVEPNIELDFPMIERHEIIHGEETREDREYVDRIKLPPMPTKLVAAGYEIISSGLGFARNVIKNQMPEATFEQSLTLLLAHGRRLGNAFFGRGMWEKAVENYVKAIEVMAEYEESARPKPGEREGLKQLCLARGFFNPVYMYCFSKVYTSQQADWRIFMDLVACCNNIALCYLKLGDVSKVC